MIKEKIMLFLSEKKSQNKFSGTKVARFIEIDNKKRPQGNPESLDIWCPEPDLNRHEIEVPQDFKSCEQQQRNKG
jgi:hypothetical protein